MYKSPGCYITRGGVFCFRDAGPGGTRAAGGSMGGSASRRRRMFLSHARFIDLENAGENGDARTKWVRGCLLRPLNISREKSRTALYYNHSWRPRVSESWGLGRLEEKLRHESNEERKGKKRRKTERGREPDGGCVCGTDCLCVDGGRLAREGGRRGID